MSEASSLGLDPKIGPQLTSGWPGIIQFEAFIENRISRGEAATQRDGMEEVVTMRGWDAEIGDGEGAGKMVDGLACPCYELGAVMARCLEI